MPNDEKPAGVSRRALAQVDRIVGELDEHNEPSSARLEYQDWFKPWEKWHDAEEEILLQYVRYFYFG